MVIPSLQEASTVRNSVFSIVRVTDETAALAMHVCPSGFEGLPGESKHGFVKYRMAQRDNAQLRPLPIVELLDCPPTFRGTHLSEYSFCYPDAWGTTEVRETLVAPQYRFGTAYELTFTDAKGISATLATTDYALTGDRDAPGPVYHADLSQHDAVIRQAYAARGEVTVFRRLTIGGKPTVHAQYVVQDFDGNASIVFEYLIPSAVTSGGVTYDLLFSAQDERADDLARMIPTLTFE